MFPFDPATLPQITTRKALLAIDFQSAFTSTLPITEPSGFIGRAAELATAFRPHGDVIWVQSRFDKPRPVDPEQIIVSDESVPTPRPIPRGRRRAPSAVPEETGPPDEEAFLSHLGGGGLDSAEGCEMSAELKDVVAKGDATLFKSNYSAFQDTQLLHLLRAKMVMEVVICGSLANIGVYATAMDAATHGMAITVVEDCCGYRDEGRQSRAVNNLIKLTGCDIASCEEVLEAMQPKPKRKPSKGKGKAGPISPADKAKLSMSPGIVNPMTELRLASGSPVRASADDAGADAVKVAEAELEMSSSASMSSTASTPGDGQADTQGGLTEKKLQEGSGIDGVNLKGANGSVEELDSEVKRGGKVDGVANTDTITTPSKSANKDQQTSPSPNTHTLPSKSPASPPKSPTSPPTMDNSSPPSPTATATATNDPLTLCEGDTSIIPSLLPAPLSTTIFETLRSEISWQHMSHQGGPVPRLVAVQGSVAPDGSYPVYRHPSDEAPALLPFSPSVLAIKAETEKHLGHELNHVLIQYYRSGNDYISEHSDKTLDIVKGSFIANASLGAERTMVLRTKRLDKDPSRPIDDISSSSPSTTQTTTAPDLKQRQTQRARLPHNSLCKMGLRTNMKWLHAIRQDKRADREKTPAELAFDCGRISLTFRQIGTFLSADESTIWGQGATGKTPEEAKPVVNGQTEQAVTMLKAFGTENHSSEFDWEGVYGGGFDVLHMSCSPRFFEADDGVANLRVGLMLEEYGIGYARGSLASTGGKNLAEVDKKATKFIDNNECQTTAEGDVAILLHLWNQHRAKTPAPSSTNTNDLQFIARQFLRFLEAIAILPILRHLPKPLSRETIHNRLERWETYATEEEGGPYIAGPDIELADFAFWPVLRYLVEGEGGVEVVEGDVFEGLDGLRRYYELFKARGAVGRVLSRPKAEK